jgi:hypothetical protein
MLTILDSVDPLSWSLIKCRCDCGNEVVLPYMSVYRCQYSCGCARRTTLKEVDHTGLEIHNAHGNHYEGRKLTVLCRDEDSRRWVYQCHCCDHTFEAPAGGDRGLHRTLRDLAGQVCPEWREYKDWRTALNHWGHRWMRSYEEKDLDWFVSGYDDQRRVKREDGKIIGFRGEPDRPVVIPGREHLWNDAPVPVQLIEGEFSEDDF